MSTTVAREIAFTKPSEFVRTRSDEIRINEIFFSLQGESSRVGLPTVFVRLTGCPLRCGYCDTAYAFHEGKTRTIDDVLAEVATHGAQYVCVTGGEPLAQKNCLTLLTRLCDAGYSVSLETSGALDVSTVDSRVSRIVDIKTPGSGEVEKNQWANLAQLRQSDELKFVLTSEDDYQWAKRVILDRRLDAVCPVLLSPAFAELEYSQLAEWVLRDKLKVRMQVQLHKVIWGERRGV
ncbi:MAG: 7-carboxy-7-deazaguanine synthase QueE [Rhodocyclaceae bacterium]|nr:7-carboxy-7-deazaguanine synthase QueE [Rhodocyclaceae bacterium]MCA3024969.1 7-carboxy-7-deazaguanine synthase QueE [Rhodocyclaceae bacterium]MCA3030264.1 7-carboxy-7-deazaguanine synthase QueE [Rhodocyclaceae bacterium]MCA3033226.1 7-carboxy-7-deazaguanine synthase QueE [Rhodocyclaceae bacterium]MCA3040377.1 7-carboxy-7-deazaguanine synthase QueE [Rhodocyclaceae bacterium]